MPKKTVVISNTIPEKLRTKLKTSVKDRGHRINFVLEKLIEYYVISGLPQEKR